MRTVLLSSLVAVGLTTFTLASPEPGQAPAPAAAAQGAAPAPCPKEGGRGDAPLPETKPIVWEAGKKKVLIVGGGSSHRYTEFYNVMDSATLSAAGFSVNYTEDRDQTVQALPNADVAVLSVNRRCFDSPDYRKVLFDFANAGKGIVLVHAGAWYMYPQWPEIHATIIGGGARGHDKLGPFTVTVVKADHPVTKGVPASFEVVDELYHVNPDPAQLPAGTASIDVLAETSPSAKYMKAHPAVWITQHPKARIVAITLGHDERVHDLQAFKTLLVNAVNWVGSPR
jgi:type 1 glutamine amidotransferase